MSLVLSDKLSSCLEMCVLTIIAARTAYTQALKKRNGVALFCLRLAVSENNWRRLHQLSSRPLGRSKKSRDSIPAAPTRSCAAQVQCHHTIYTLSRTRLSTIILLLWRDAFKQLHNDALCYLFSILQQPSSERASEHYLSI